MPELFDFPVIKCYHLTEMSKLTDLGSNSSLACRALPALALAPPKKGKPKKLQLWLPKEDETKKAQLCLQQKIKAWTSLVCPRMKTLSIIILDILDV